MGCPERSSGATGGATAPGTAQRCPRPPSRSSGRSAYPGLPSWGRQDACLFGLGLADYHITGVLTARLAWPHHGPCRLPIYTYYPAAFFSDLLQQITKRVWFIAAYIYGVLSSHSDGIPLCASQPAIGTEVAKGRRGRTPRERRLLGESRLNGHPLRVATVVTMTECVIMRLDGVCERTRRGS
jgi:hypothetical protein